MTEVLGSSRRYPCGHAKAKFKTLEVVTRRCAQCKNSWTVDFESAAGASRLTGQIVWKARWTEINREKVVA